MFNSLSSRWSSEGGYRQVLKIAFPLILSTGAWSVQHFVDRMFLTWYSPATIAASMPAGMLNFTIVSLFLGTVGYVNTFIAQYYGAEKKNRIGPVIWQGLYISLLGGVVLFLIAPFSGPIFKFIGHEASIQTHEILYFKYLCMGGFPLLASAALSGFFAGRGQTWPIMWVNAAGTAFNLIFDYFLIFGHGPFPELGIKGAAIATVFSACFTTLLYVFLIMKKRNNKTYHMLKGWRPDRLLMARIIRFGLPSGIQFFIDIAGFSSFILIMGRLGKISLAASNIAFNINTLAFMPMIGCGIAISVLVGQYLGKNDPDKAQKSTFSGFHLTFAYMSSVALLYVLVPDLFINPFARNADPVEFQKMREIVLVLLKFVAIYSLFDTMNLVFAFAIKGAGDTRYVLKMILISSILFLVIPTYVAIVLLKQGIYVAWAIASLYITILGFTFLRRFLQGKWKSMRVIEEPSHVIPPTFPEAPSKEFEV
ncbi:MAG: MATE family efflux transporter [Spirochaetes bacterium]|nr:MATE family efflux transporter [Spirochaetota bacterium]